MKKDANEYFQKFLQSGSDLLADGTWKQAILQANIGVRKSSLTSIIDLIRQLNQLFSDP